MNIIEIISKKRDKEVLTKQEIDFVISEYTNEKIPDYQMSSLLMAILLNGMNIEETSALTNAMINSGEVVDLSSIEGIKCDKHSTGGVGDKVSLVLAPLLAACDVKVAKMSGRGLGHTGGTLDKLESIPGFNIFLEADDFIKQVKEINVSIIGQTGNLVPADKKLYALRDVTGTVQSIPLIASSIMSKKLASGSNAILLDVKVGKGAFMKTFDDAVELSKTMVGIGQQLDKDLVAVITDMNQPLGYGIGNALEVKEVIETLKGNGPSDLTEICLTFASIMLVQAKVVADTKEGYQLALEKLNDLSAFNKFVEFVKAQGGDENYILDPNKFELSKNIIEVKSTKDGYLNSINALEVGLVALELGAGRHKIEDKIDYSAGVVLCHKVNDKIKKDETIAYLHTNKDIDEKLITRFQNAININEKKTDEVSLIKKIITSA